jgi:hypothetical protein
VKYCSDLHRFTKEYVDRFHLASSTKLCSDKKPSTGPKASNAVSIANNKEKQEATKQEAGANRQ